MASDHDPWRTAFVAADVLAVSHGTDAMVAARRDERLQALLHAATASPLWRERLQHHRVEQGLRGLPPVGKRELMANFDRGASDPRLVLPALKAFMADPANIGTPFEGRWIVWESSGSSGEPGLFVQDAAAMAVYDALEGLRRPMLQPLRRWFDPWLLRERIAFVGAIHGHFASTVSMRRLARLQPGFAARTLAVDFLQPLPVVVAQLNAFAPSVLATYPSAALLLAQEARAGRLRVALAEVWTGGETLGPAVRAEVESAFGCPLADSYGASEFLALAASCAQGRLHLNADWVILEPVDARGRPVPAGVCGDKVWLTNLANHVQPLLRYELGDRVTLHDTPCACGSPLPVIEVQGRSDDVLELRATGGRRVRLLPLALTTVIEERGGVFDFQLVQAGARALRLDVAAPHRREDAQRACDALRDYLSEQGLGGVRVTPRCVAAVPAGRSGKRRRVIAGAPA
ncbi:MAG: phenylacetate--CoA ligase family protein [Piscinibacter sp.]|uniref:phenylacetate--CoA ligase family protein n=1 Tax=Piscinibacter sp. TaxID=1903157 RepID=UPI003D145958